MKRTMKILSLLLAFSLLLIPTQTAAAHGLGDGPVIFGGSYTLGSGETLNGDVVVFGGVVTIEADAVVNGSVVVFGGSLTIDGQVNGDVVLLGGAAALGENSLISGDLALVGATLERADGAQVNGSITYNDPGIQVIDGHRIVAPELRDLPDLPVSPRIFRSNPLWLGMGVFGRSLAMALLALLVALFLEEPTRRVGEAAAAQPAIAGGLGFLTVILAPAVLVILAITIILAPVALLAVLVLMIAFLYGWIALGFEVGLRFTKMLKVNWAFPLTAAFGTWLLTIISDSLGLIPCVGWLAPFILAVIALGGVTMSRFGSQVSVPAATKIVPAAPAEPIPSVDGDEK